MWQGWINGILGIWLIVASFILTGTSTGFTFWNELIVGVIVAILGFTSATGKAQKSDE